MQTCLILGANGLIGSHLVDALVHQNQKVKAFDRFNEKTHKFLPHPHIEIISGDFSNQNDLRIALKGVDYVFHFISTTTPATTENDPLIDIETNIKMSVQLFQECLHHNVKKIIYASSGGAIYGETNQEQPIAETTLPQPISPYAIGKLAIEHYLRYFKTKHHLDSMIFRISNAYGERCSFRKNQGVISHFLQQIIHHKPITIFGDGEMVRDYIHVKDVARLITAAYQETRQPIYNLGSGTGVSTHEIVHIIQTLVNSPIEINYAPQPKTYLKKIVLDTALYTHEFKQRPQIRLEDGIKTTWEYLLDNH